MFEREAARARDVFDAEQERHVSVADRDAFEVVVIRRHQVEEVLVAIAVEDDVAIAGGLDDDGLVGRAALREGVSALEGRAVSGDGGIEAAIDEAVVLIYTGVDKDGVAGLDTRRGGVGVVGLIVAL